MTHNNRNRVIRIEKGETLYVVCPPYQPFRVFFDSRLNDLVVAECEPQDVPTIEENAPAVPQAMAAEVINRAIEQVDENVRALQNLRPDRDIQVAIEQGIIKPLLPDRFNKPSAVQVVEEIGHDVAEMLNASEKGETAQLHKQAITETLGPIAQLYKHEKEVMGATVVTYKPESPDPYQRQGETLIVEPEPAREAQRPDPLQSDIPFFNEPT